MHEFSIAMNIVEIAETETRKAGATAVSKIDLEVGSMSGIVIEALEFALESAVRNTVLHKAECNIIRLPALGRCVNCGHEFSVENYFDQCPECESFNPEIIQGKELKVKSLVVN